MADTEPTTTTVNLEDLAQYILLGVDKDGKHVSIMSGQLTIHDMSSFLARAQTNLSVQIVAAGLEMYRQHQQAKASPIIRPGMQ